MSTRSSMTRSVSVPATCRPVIRSDSEAIKTSKSIDQQIKADRRNRLQDIKLLLLGCSECGKSTILKQVRILHDSGFTQSEMQQSRSFVFSQTIGSMLDILDAMNELDIPLESKNEARECDSIIFLRWENENTIHKPEAAVILRLRRGSLDGPMTGSVKRALERLWADKGVQLAFRRAGEFHLSDSAEYFFNSLPRLCAADYTPTSQDMLRLKIHTAGVVKHDFTKSDLQFRIIDVGGQRAQRRKWIHVFDDATAVIFVASLGEFDQVLKEDGKTNRMLESLALFKQICNGAWFRSTPVILFLNKKDLFAEKIKQKSISIAFRDFNGKQTYDSAIEFIEEKYVESNENEKRPIYVHQTCAVDTNQIELVLASVLDMVTKINMHFTGVSET